jgi:hypothetical protein
MVTHYALPARRCSVASSNSSSASEIETDRESNDTHHTREHPRDPGFVTVVVTQQSTHHNRYRQGVQVHHGAWPTRVANSPIMKGLRKAFGLYLSPGPGVPGVSEKRRAASTPPQLPQPRYGKAGATDEEHSTRLPRD